MSFGLRVMDESGDATLDTRDGVTKVFGSFTVSGNGSLQDSRLNGVRAWVIAASTSSYGFRAEISGITLSWEMLIPQSPGLAWPTLVMYGSY